MQLLGIGGLPMRRNELARTAIEASELIGDIVEGQDVQRPALDGGGGLVERTAQAQAHVGIERRLRRLLDGFDPLAQSGDRARG